MIARGPAANRRAIRTLVVIEVAWVVLTVVGTAAVDHWLGPLDAPTVFLIGFLAGGMAMSFAAKVIFWWGGAS